jgi:hypothetical protein
LKIVLRDAWIPGRKITINIHVKVDLFMEQTVNYILCLEHSYKEDWKSRLNHTGRHLGYDLKGERRTSEER